MGRIQEWELQEISRQQTMTCLLHEFNEVSNHYDDDGILDTETFSDGEWRIEKVCEKCKYVLDTSNFGKLKHQTSRFNLNQEEG